MAGHRDDGTFAEDNAHNPNRKVHKGRWVDPDPTPPHGTPRPSMDFIGEHSNENDETLDPWDQEDIDEQKRFRDEANKRGHL